jgi:hypothetical protein
MKVLLNENVEEAAERVRKRDGDRSITKMVERLIWEADAKCGEETERRFASGTPKRGRKGARS